MLYMLNFLQLATVKSQIYNRTDICGILIYCFLFLIQPHLFHFSFSSPPPSPSPLSHSFSSFLFPVALLSSRSLKKSHHQFRFYPHWSNHINLDFFFPFWFALSSVHFSPFCLWLLANLKVVFVLPPKIPAAHWSRRKFQSSWSLIPTTRNGAKTELDSNGPKTELDSNDLTRFFSDCGSGFIFRSWSAWA